ncbi:pyocin S6 family toxin immunity protein [Pseudomonas sp. NFX224]|uniref:pyocin S6 family toxin immunity protein n=1 Tax=Pseudomonas sp. NFX224 TaxID=3402862 RepID=UPI003AFAE75D
MFLWISGFFKGDDKDDSLKYELTVQPEFEGVVMGVLGWKSLDESADGEWLLSDEQVQKIASALKEPLPSELDLFIGVRG